MAPSAVETAQPTAADIKAKLTINEKPADAVYAPQNVDEDLPVRLEGHKEPLKLSGALDHLESFDVTPVIGREYAASVDLVELLRAPNSDELIRDLAITSSSPLSPRCFFSHPANPIRSLPARRRLLPRPEKPDRRPAEGARRPPRQAVGQAGDLGPAYPPHQQRRPRARRRG